MTNFVLINEDYKKNCEKNLESLMSTRPTCMTWHDDHHDQAMIYAGKCWNNECTSVFCYFMQIIL